MYYTVRIILIEAKNRLISLSGLIIKLPNLNVFNEPIPIYPYVHGSDPSMIMILNLPSIKRNNLKQSIYIIILDIGKQIANKSKIIVVIY